MLGRDPGSRRTHTGHDLDIQELQEVQKLQEEELEWLHIQTEILKDIRRHTGLLYAIGIIWLTLLGLSVILGICLAVIAAAGA